MEKHLDLDDVCSGHPEAAKELAELRKDAARINWIERQTLDELSMGVLQDCEDDGDYFVSGDKHFGNGPTLRAAIDAAIAESLATEETSTTCANVAAAIRRANAKGGQKTMKIETGVMIIKDGKAWGIIYEDGYSTSYGWIAPENAPIHNPKFLKRPEDVTYRESRYVVELRSAKLVQVERRTEVILKS